jgi:hypothetical protein
MLAAAATTAAKWIAADKKRHDRLEPLTPGSPRDVKNQIMNNKIITG